MTVQFFPLKVAVISENLLEVIYTIPVPAVCSALVVSPDYVLDHQNMSWPLRTLCGQWIHRNVWSLCSAKALTQSTCGCIFWTFTGCKKTPQLLCNTLAEIQSSIHFSKLTMLYPNKNVKIILKNDHNFYVMYKFLGSVFELCCIQYCVVINSDEKRYVYIMWQVVMLLLIFLQAEWDRLHGVFWVRESWWFLHPGWWENTCTRSEGILYCLWCCCQRFRVSF